MDLIFTELLAFILNKKNVKNLLHLEEIINSRFGNNFKKKTKKIEIVIFTFL